MKHTLNPRKDGVALFVAAIVAVAPFANTQARSMLYYCDFDTVTDGTLTWVNNGTGEVEPTVYQNGATAPGYAQGGPWGSGYALRENVYTTLLLGDGSASLGCGTTRGFTISLWVLAPADPVDWTDFFGFRQGNADYRFEFTDNGTDFRVYSGHAETQYARVTRRYNDDFNDPANITVTELKANTWTHIALVATPNGTNSVGTCSLYVGGEKVARINLLNAGDLQQLYVGSAVRTAPQDANSYRWPTGNPSGACLDELALFDYPATPEHVKWLSRHKPAQPLGGPGRAMPIAWKFDTANSTDNIGVLATNSGTGEQVAYKWNNSGAHYNYSPSGALNSAISFYPITVAGQANNGLAYRIDDTTSADGLGATLGSGVTVSFWLKSPEKVTGLTGWEAWRDFLTFRIGDRRHRFEWCNPVDDAPAFRIYRASDDLVGLRNYHEDDPSSYDGASVSSRIVPGADWCNVCMVWEAASSKMRIYLNGENTKQVVQFLNPAATEALKILAVGAGGLDENDNNSRPNANPNVYLDEVAVFNNSLSPEQIKWLSSNIPSLPPLDTTNLVRTVSADGACAGGLASWGVREWSGTEWADTTRTTIYPSCEDTEVEAAVTFAANATLSNDTFVTPKRLSVSGIGSLACEAGSLFAPEMLELTDGARLTVPVAAALDGRFAPKRITFGSDARIVFDITGLESRSVTVPFAASAMALPVGESDVIAHFAVKGRPSPAIGGVGKISLVPNDGGLLVKCIMGLKIIFR
jgi:hypothetical protein